LPFFLTLFCARRIEKIFGRTIFSITGNAYNNIL
jgi:hypothetical protein